MYIYIVCTYVCEEDESVFVRKKILKIKTNLKRKKIIKKKLCTYVYVQLLYCVNNVGTVTHRNILRTHFYVKF